MMLSIQFALTTAQTKMLISIAFENYVGELMLPEYKRSNPQTDFVGVAQRLIARGLVSHHQDCPAYRVTPEGMALANMIVKECRWAVELADSLNRRRKANKPAIDEQNFVLAQRANRMRP